MYESKITHRQIEAFRALMLTGSMTEAARLLSVTQPAVSKIISQLEQEIGFGLFDRRQGRLKPTNDAFILFADVKQSYTGLERVAQTARRIRSGTGGSLRLAILPTMATGFIVQVSRRLYMESSKIQLSLQGYGSEEIADLVASGLYDLGFAAPPVDTTRVQVGSVLTIPSFCILPPGHRLSDRDRVSIKDLNGETFIATAEGLPSRLRTDALFATMNVQRNIMIEARWSLTICELVQANLGCSIIDGFTAFTFAKRGGIVKPLAEPLDFTFVQVTNTSAASSSTLRTFQTIFDSEFATFQKTLVAGDFLSRSTLPDSGSVLE